MSRVLGFAVLALGLLVAPPAYCIDQEVRTAAVDALLARDAAKLKHDAAVAEATTARAAWLEAWAKWQTELAAQQTAFKAATPKPEEAIKALEDRPKPPEDSDAPSSPDLRELSANLETLKTKVDAAQPAEAPPGEKLKAISTAITDTKTKVDEQAAKLEKEEKALAAAEETYQKSRDAFDKGTGPSRYLAERLRAGRALRCLTAYCYGGVDGTKFGIEPVLDLPVGLVWSAGSGALTSYVNSHTVNVEFNAGLRFWVGYDIMSVSIYFSKPLITGSDSIRVAGSSFEHTPSAVHRPFPSLGLGFAGDVLLLGISYDQLRNGSTDGTRDRAYPANAVLSRSLTFSLGFSLFNISKNALAKSKDSTDSESAGGGK
jgi:hypothetical protein